MLTAARVLFLSKYYLPHIGGVEKHIFEVSRILQKMSIKISILSATKEQYKHKPKSIITKHYIPITQTKYLGLIKIWIWTIKNRR